MEAPLLAIEKYDDGRSTLRILTAGTDLILLSDENAGTGMVQVSADDRHLEVFRTDLEDRASKVSLDLRRAG